MHDTFNCSVSYCSCWLIAPKTSVANSDLIQILNCVKECHYKQKKSKDLSYKNICYCLGPYGVVNWGYYYILELVYCIEEFAVLAIFQRNFTTLMIIIIDPL